MSRTRWFLTAGATTLLLWAPTLLYSHSRAHHGGAGADCFDRGSHGCTQYSTCRPRRGSDYQSEAGVATITMHTGRIAEVVYLPGDTPDHAMVFVSLLENDKTVLVRLGPAGFLKQSSVILKEGNAISVMGYAVATTMGYEFVATDIATDRVKVRLRDPLGRPRW